MKALKLNLELTKEIYEMYKYDVEMKLCYNNTFQVASSLIMNKQFKVEDFKIAYGFMYRECIDMFVRHAYIIYKGEVIDVTACTWNSDLEKESEELKYYAFKELEFFEYNDVLIENEGLPALYDAFLEDEIAIYNELTEKGLCYNPQDYMTLLITNNNKFKIEDANGITISGNINTFIEMATEGR